MLADIELIFGMWVYHDELQINIMVCSVFFCYVILQCTMMRYESSLCSVLWNIPWIAWSWWQLSEKVKFKFSLCYKNCHHFVCLWPVLLEFSFWSNCPATSLLLKIHKLLTFNHFLKFLILNSHFATQIMPWSKLTWCKFVNLNLNRFLCIQYYIL